MEASAAVVSTAAVIVDECDGNYKSRNATVVCGNVTASTTARPPTSPHPAAVYSVEQRRALEMMMPLSSTGQQKRSWRCDYCKRTGY